MNPNLRPAMWKWRLSPFRLLLKLTRWQRPSWQTPSPVEAIADEAIAVGLTEVVEDAVPVAAELQPVDTTVTDDAVETELAEPVAEVEVVAVPEAAVEAVEPLPIPEPVLESVQAAKEEQVTSLRDLPEDIWQVAARSRSQTRTVGRRRAGPHTIRGGHCRIAWWGNRITPRPKARRPSGPRRSKCKCTRRWRKAA